MKKNTVIYKHVRLDTNQTFYIGIGTKIRAFSKHKRNKYWNNIINKTNYEVQILKSDLTWEDACELEKILISYYGRKDNNTGILSNMTDGGEGSYGRKQSQNCKNKISNANKGKVSKLKGIKFSKERCEKISKSKIGISNLKNSKKVIDVSTGEIYNNPKEVCILRNYVYSTFTSKLNNNRKNNTTFKYIENLDNISEYNIIPNNKKHVKLFNFEDYCNFCKKDKKWIVIYNSEIIGKFENKNQAIKISKYVYEEFEKFKLY